MDEAEERAEQEPRTQKPPQVAQRTGTEREILIFYP
jgi:hypothetical protein